jgi:RNA recognition motif-containing protein
MVQKIYVGNLPFDATERDLSAAFARFGEVVSIALPTDRETGRPRRFGLIEMSSEDATKAIAGLNGKDFGGRALNVNEVRPCEAAGNRSYGAGSCSNRN